MESVEIHRSTNEAPKQGQAPDVSTLAAQAEAVSDIYAERFDIHRDATWYLAKLTEEMGELQAAYLAAQGGQRGQVSSEDARQNLEDEAADLFGFLLVFAQWQGIDLADAFSKKWGHHLQE